jgi:hypothetical protein
MNLNYRLSLRKKVQTITGFYNPGQKLRPFGGKSIGQYPKAVDIHYDDIRTAVPNVVHCIVSLPG